MLLAINGALFGFVSILLAHPDGLIDLIPVGSIVRFLHLDLGIHPRVCLKTFLWASINNLDETILQWVARIWIEGHLAIMVILALFNIWYSLRGFRRLVWGDLTGYSLGGEK